MPTHAHTDTYVYIHTHTYIWSPPPHDPPLFLFSSKILYFAVLFVSLLSTILQSSFSIELLRNTWFSLRLLVRNQELSVFWHILGLPTEKTLSLSIKALSHAAICFGFRLASRNIATQQNHPKPKTKKPKSGRESFGFGWIFGFFGFTLSFLVFASKNQKNPMCFFWFSWCRVAEKPTKPCVFLVFE